MSKKSMLTVVLTIALLSSFLLVSSCKKTNNITENPQEDIETPVSESDYSESNEDLVSVNYQEVYDELADHGEWLQVNADDIGLNRESSEIESHRSKSVASFFFIEDAMASADIDVGMFFVWRPSPNIAVGLAAGTATLAPVYVPYTNGQWVYTDAGYYFQAYTPYEEIVHHYGRWVFHPVYGWVWVPGRVWAPAWVTWYESDPYIAWAPVPPGVYITANILVPPPIDFVNYVVVERQYFFEPRIYTYYYRYPIDPVVVVPTMYSVSGVTVVNNTIVNAGPDFVRIQNVYPRPIEMVHITKVHSKVDVKYTSKEFNVYAPTFNKVKYSEKRKVTVTQPKNFVKNEDVKMNKPQMSGMKYEKRFEQKTTEKIGKEKVTGKQTEKSFKQNQQREKIKSGKDNNKQYKGNEKKSNKPNYEQPRKEKKSNPPKYDQPKKDRSGDKKSGNQDKGKQEDRGSKQDKGNKGHGKGK